MSKNNSYIQAVYNDFDNRLTWYVQHDMILFPTFTDIKNKLDRCLAMVKGGLITEREAVIAMSEIFIRNSLRS